MRKRFVIALDSTTKEQNEAFREYLKATTPGLWWHWLDDLWLVVDPTGKLGAADLRDKVCAMYPYVTNLVLEIGEGGHEAWAGFGPASREKSMFAWIEKNW